MAPGNLNKLMVALDYELPEKAFKLVDELDTLVDIYKIGPVLYTQSGLEIIRFLHRKNKKIFIDLKLYDTPQVVRKTITQLAELGVEYTTLHLLGGKQMLEAANQSCRGSKLKLMGVTLLTSLKASEFTIFNSKIDQEIVMSLLEIAEEARLSGVLCSPHELCEVRKKVMKNTILCTAGIRLPNQEIFEDDQLRFATPSEALKNGADFLIVGRPILQSASPRDRVLEIAKYL